MEESEAQGMTCRVSEEGERKSCQQMEGEWKKVRHRA